MRKKTVSLLLISFFLYSCSKNDNSYQERVKEKVKVLEACINTQDKKKYYENISSTDGSVLNFYKVFALYVSMFKAKGNESILEFSPFEITTTFRGKIKVTILIFNNKIDSLEKKKYDRGDEIVKKLIDLGLPDKIDLFFVEDADKNYKLEDVDYPMLYAWINLI